MRGRKPTPTAMKLLRGNPGRRRINPEEPQPDVIVPDAPKDLDGAALAEWKLRAPQLARLGLLTEVDHPAFVAYCRAWGRYVDAEKRIAATSAVVRAPSGYPIQNPFLAVANKALKQCQDFWARFGMTPSDRTRVSASRPKGAAPPASKVDRFMRRVK